AYGGKITFQDGPRIDVAFLASTFFLKESVDRSHILQHDFVIVGAPSIASDSSFLAAKICSLKIVHCQHDQRLGVDQNPGGIGPFGSVTTQPGHIPVAASLQPGKIFDSVRRLNSSRK